MAKMVFRFLNHISVHLVLCLCVITHLIVNATTRDLLLQKACRFHHTSEPDLDTDCDDERRGFFFIVEVNSFFRYAVMYILGVVYAVFALGWSDTGRRRRTLIFLPVIGLIFRSVAGCVNTYFWTWSPYATLWLNNVLEVMSGGITLMMMASITYVCDVTDVKSRTMELGLLFAAKMFGEFVSSISSSFVLHSVGFFYTFLICFALSLTMLAVVVFFVKDISVRVANTPNFCQSLIRIAGSGKVVFDGKLGINRIIVLMLFIVNTLVLFTTVGERHVQQIFLIEKFNWSIRPSTLFYVIYRMIGVILGNIFCSVVLSRIMNVHDGIIGIFAGSCSVIAVIGCLFASQVWHLYIVFIFEIFHETAYSVSVAFYSKYYTSDEFGRLQSFACLFSLMLPVSVLAYNFILAKTMYVFPSAYFILSLTLDIAVVLLYIGSYLVSRKSQNGPPVANNQHNVEPSGTSAFNLRPV